MKNFKAGTFINQGHYRSFQPNLINRPWSFSDAKVQTLLSKADRELGRLDMFSNYVPNIELFISMHVLKEATKSSKIEGTQTTMEEALLKEDQVPQERRNDWVEVQNYLKATTYAIDRLIKFPLSSRLIRETHNLLMKGVRGQNKNPGEFRTSQNWIGGSSIERSTFVPPVHSSIMELMADIEKFIHNDKIHLPELIKIGLIHYQFETIHPFLDGNGRIGRLLITLYLVNKGLIKKPILYLSDFFERNRQEYYNRLMDVRLKDDIKSWLCFFLEGVQETATNSITTLENTLALKDVIESRISESISGSRSTSARQLIEHLYRNPVIDAKEAAQVIDKSLPTTYTVLKELVNLELLSPIALNRKKTSYLFSQFVSLYT